MDKSIIVVVPIWRDKFTESEIISLTHLVKYLYKIYPICIITKKELVPFIKQHEILNKFNFKIFDDSYFSYQGYNKLLRSSYFYESFIQYKYMLIYQTDCMVFSNSLDYWVNKDLDYVGAPWLISKKGNICYYKTGNGGLSLRKISSFIHICKEYKKLITKARILGRHSILSIIVLLKKVFINRDVPNYHIFTRNEDVFFSHLGALLMPSFKVSNYNDSIKFAFDKHPQKCFELNNNFLPFGCHGFEKNGKTFWNEFKLKN